MVNRVILIGNIGKDPEVRKLESGAMVAKFSIATNENYKDRSGEWQQQTEWHDIVVWRTLAERAENSLKKGMSVYIEGKLTHRSWQDQDGNNRKTTEVVASYFRILNSNPGRRDMGESTTSQMNTPSNMTSQTNVDTGGMSNEDEDDLPF
ncbi:MAG: single-stranded DNA-binding protein [Bacteroidota bacterium]